METIKQLKTNARTAGMLYLLIILTGLFSEMFVRSGIIVPNDGAATTANIANHTFLFRIGFISDLTMVMSDAAVALLLFLILKPVNYGLSLLAAFFRLAQATIIGVNLLNYYMPLLILGNGSSLAGFSPEQINSMVLLFLNAHNYGYLISGVFFGVSCVILGYLLFKAEYFPKWLGVLVVAAGTSYLIDCIVNFLLPELTTSSEILVMSVAVTSELSLCLFLLIKGTSKTSALTQSKR